MPELSQAVSSYKVYTPGCHRRLRWCGAARSSIESLVLLLPLHSPFFRHRLSPPPGGAALGPSLCLLGTSVVGGAPSGTAHTHICFAVPVRAVPLIYPPHPGVTLTRNSASRNFLLQHDQAHVHLYSCQATDLAFAYYSPSHRVKVSGVTPLTCRPLLLVAG